MRWAAGALVAAALLMLWRYHHVAVKEFGGITGDLAGWFLQKAEFLDAGGAGGQPVGEAFYNMMFITGPLYSGKRTFARQFAGSCITDVQDKAADAADLTQLAEELAQYDIVIATEVGGGVVPMDAEERAGREAAGRLACLLAERADCVVQMFCGIPTVLKGELPKKNADLFTASRSDGIQRPEALSGPAGYPALARGSRPAPQSGF